MLLGTSSSAVASSPTVGRNFRLNVSPGDTTVVTFVEDLPVTSADTYFEIFMPNWGTDGVGVVEGQLVYPIPWQIFGNPTGPVEIWLGTYGTVTNNGVEIPTFDGELIDGVQSVDSTVSGPGTWGYILMRGIATVTDPVLWEKWSTLEFVPSDWNGLTQEEIATISATLRSLRTVDYGFSYSDVYLYFACASGSFSVHPKVSLGPDHFVEGPAHTINCPGNSDIMAKYPDTGVEIANGGTFAFPDAPLASLPLTRDINICDAGPGSLAFPENASSVSGDGFTYLWPLSPGLSVGPGHCDTLRLRFSASALGTYTGSLTIHSNDPDEDPFTIVLSATVREGPPPPINQPPAVDAGSDVTITLPQVAVLDGTVTDDGLPNPPGAVTTVWTESLTVGPVQIANPNAVDTTASFTVPGSYTLLLTARDGEKSSQSDVNITVLPAANQPPVVNAGPDQTITLPGGASLDGTVSDDGLPNPPASLTTTWSKLSGPGTVSFANASATDTTVFFSAPGDYVLRLTTNDGAAAVSDDINVTVNPAPPGSNIYLSATANGSLPGVGAYADEDILAFNPADNTWSLYFDGSDVGLGSGDVDALAILPNGHLLLSTDSALSLPGVGAIDDSDIVEFTPSSLGSTTAGTYSLYFDGSDVGLSTNDEDVDGIALTPDGRLVISTLGNYSVPGLSSGTDEDLIVLNNGVFGSNTSGNWALYFDGSDVGLSGSENIADAWIGANGDIYLVAGSNFAVNGGVSGQASDIFRCTPGSLGATTACTYSFFWDGAAYNFGSATIDGLALDD
jgi:hypothetical protein